MLNSSAEEELIRAIRLLRAFPQWVAPDDAATSALRDFLAQQLDPRQRLNICSRSLIQTDVFQAVAGQNSQLFFRKVTWRHPIADYLAVGDQFLVVLDEPEDLSRYDFGVFGSLSPALRQDFIEEQRRRYATNRDMDVYVAGLPRDAWRVAEHAVSPHLRMVVVRRIVPLKKSGQ